jgi:transcriptional regulator with XRE-family HTH domain
MDDALPFSAAEMASQSDCVAFPSSTFVIRCNSGLNDDIGRLCGLSVAPRIHRPARTDGAVERKPENRPTRLGHAALEPVGLVNRTPHFYRDAVEAAECVHGWHPRASRQARKRARSFGELLRQHRLAQGLTQEALAELAGLSAHGVLKLERGSTHLYGETAERLSRALYLTDEGVEINFKTVVAETAVGGPGLASDGTHLRLQRDAPGRPARV